MRYIFSYLCVLFFSYTSISAQTKCFESCRDQLENSSLPPPDGSKDPIEQLVGCKVPDFQVKTIKGEILSMKDLRGKVVVLNFWFTSCSPCVAEMPGLNRLVEEYQGKDVVFIGFARDQMNSLASFLDERVFKYKIVSGAFDLSFDYCIIGGWPTNMVIDGNGYLTKAFSGGFQDEQRASDFVYNEIKPSIDRGLAAIAK